MGGVGRGLERARFCLSAGGLLERRCTRVPPAVFPTVCCKSFIMNDFLYMSSVLLMPSGHDQGGGGDPTGVRRVCVWLHPPIFVKTELKTI